jgi:AraC-like DNA-binding protein
MIDKLISSFKKKYEKYFFKYNNGTFELPIIGNSPQGMIDSMLSMPFVKHEKEEQVITSNTMFVNGKIQYHSLEEGLMILVSQLHFKKDVNFKRVFDIEFPIDYYYLTCCATNKTECKDPIINGYTFSKNYWSLFKPGTIISDFHFTGSKVLYISVYFHKDYLANKIKLNPKLYNNFKVFIESKTEFYIGLSDLLNNHKVHSDIPNKLNEENKDIEFNLTLHQIIEEYIGAFNQQMNDLKVSNQYFEMSYTNRLACTNTEEVLSNNLNKPFPSISTLALNQNISESTLKTNFKLIYGTTMKQYYINQRMKYAKDMISKNKKSIKELVEYLGFENHSNFTNAFKSYFGYPPSETSRELLI